LNSYPGLLRQAGNRPQASIGNISVWYFKKGIEGCQLQVAYSQAKVIIFEVHNAFLLFALTIYLIHRLRVLDSRKERCY